MKWIVLYVTCIFFIIQYTKLVQSQVECPDPDPANCTAAGDKFPDYNDCHQYFVCTDSGGDFQLSGPFICTDGYYDETLGECNTSTTTCTNACGPGGTVGICTFYGGPGSCGPSFANVASDEDCSQYYTCDSAGAQGFLRTCNSPTLYFDGTTCTADPNTCCRCSQPVCDGTTIEEKEDPYDCTSYYLCFDDESPPLYASCEDGFIYIEGSGCTNTGGTCTSLCFGGATSGQCDDNFNCPASGYYPYCTVCDINYYYCASASATPSLDQCNAGDLFDPVAKVCSPSCT